MAFVVLLFISTLSMHGALSQQPVVNLEAGVRSFPGQNGDVTFKAGIDVLLSRKNHASRDFILDTSAQFPVLSKCKSSSVTKTVNFTFSGRVDGFMPAGTVAVPVSVSCTNKRNAVDVAAFGSGSSSLPSQIFKSTRLPSRFAYCLDHLNSFSQLSIGRKTYRLFNNSDVLDSRLLSFTRTSLAVNSNPRAGSTAYLLQLKKVSFNSESLQVKEIIQIGTTSRFTVLPNSAYDFVRQRVERESVKHKVSRTGARVGPLPLCYTLTPTQIKNFPVVSMELEGKAVWKIPPSNYLVPLSQKNSNNVFCFGFIKAGTAPSVIGTFQQENVYVEFDEAGKTFRFTEPLLATYKLGCSNTFGS